MRKKNSKSRNKWGKRGRNLASFVVSFFEVILDFLVKMIVDDFKSAKRHFANRKKTKAAQKSKTVSAAKIGTVPNQAGQAKFLPTKLSKQVRLSQVIGLDAAKAQIAQRMILPFEHADKAKVLGIVGGGGLLLIGPPGNGKTTLAKAVAAEVKAELFHIKPSDIVRPGVGNSEQRIAELFRTIRSKKRVVLFLDDAEGLIPSRSKNSSTIMQRVVNQMLVEWDGLESSSENILLFMAASNEPWNIDLAFRRPGRFDVIVYVGLPDLDGRVNLLKQALNEKPVASDVDVNQIAEQTDGYSGADVVELVNRATQKAFEKSISQPDSEAISICAEDLNAALLEVKPSVVAKDIKRLEKFCQDYSLNSATTQSAERG